MLSYAAPPGDVVCVGGCEEKGGVGLRCLGALRFQMGRARGGGKVAEDEELSAFCGGIRYRLLLYGERHALLDTSSDIM